MVDKQVVAEQIEALSDAQKALVLLSLMHRAAGGLHDTLLAEWLDEALQLYHFKKEERKVG